MRLEATKGNKLRAYTSQRRDGYSQKYRGAAMGLVLPHRHWRTGARRQCFRPTSPSQASNTDAENHDSLSPCTALTNVYADTVELQREGWDAEGSPVMDLAIGNLLMGFADGNSLDS